MSASDSTHSLDGIAIIGMSGRFPGARSVAQFWKNLAGGVESITKFSEAETEFSVASADEKAKGRRVVRARGILEQTDLFDAAFFGIYPREAELMDPQHRFFLECAWEALESAGYDPEAYPGMIGVYAGLSMNTYMFNNLVRDRAFAANFAGNYQIGEYQVMMGNDKDFMPTRVSYKLNLRGPSMAVQTACSTSLVAVSQACTSLLNYQCDMALAGGVSITFPQKRDYFYEEDGMASVDGTCRTFDANAKGTVFGHGTAVVLLKRLADAVADGDHVLAVIKGTAVNNDGSEKIGYAAPSVKAQADVIAMAQAAAGVSPEDISYVETHGTGTPLGDPIEVAALTEAFRAGGATRNGYCALGTGKTNISHLDVAAGATGLIKLVLQLQHEAIPPLLHFTAPNPKIDFAGSPFFPVTKLTPWKRGATPRRAGVSAFGVGGTNAHAVVEEAPALAPSGPARAQQLIVLSARTESALAAMSANLVDALETDPALNLADVAFTLHQGRRAFAHRRAFVASDATDAALKLKALDAKIVATGHAGKDALPVAFVFPGQGSQHVDMGRELYENEPVFRAEVDLCAGILQQHLEVDIRTVLYPEAAGRELAQKRIGETSVTQPALFVVEYALAKLWLSWGVKPAVLIGHSIGEYVCAVLAESFTLEDALALLATRARLMQQLPAGSMLAVRLPASETEPLLPAGASIAAINSVKTCTVSGPTPVLEKLLGDLTARKIAARLLPTSHAFHSAMMDPILAEFSAAAAKTARQAPTIPWISTCTGEWMSAAVVNDATYWSRQLRQPVKFTAALDTLFKDTQPAILEVGPGQALSQLVRQHPEKATATPVVSTLGPEGETSHDLSSILLALGRLWIAGVKLDWSALYAEQTRQRVPLPTYPFERQRFWIEPVKIESPSMPASSLALPEEKNAVLEIAAVPEPAESEPVNPPVALEPRRARIATQLRHAIKDLSGLEVTDDKTSFVEMGFDSLFLTQASQEFQRQYGIKVTFRQLINELSTVSDLSRHFDEKLPPEPPPAPVQPKPAAPKASATVARATPAAPSVTGVPASDLVRQLLQQQREFMNQQLPLLNSVLGASANLALPPAAPAPLSLPKALPAAATTGAVPVVGGVQNNAFGPSAGAKGAEIELTPAQRRYLDDLIGRYTKKTAGSKALTQKYRQWYADPRTASGFNRQWKEMCYQLVVESSKGSRLRDIDGNEYIDMLNGFGPNFLGHSPSFVTEALKRQLDLGIEVGPQSPIAGEASRLFCELTGNERASFVNTGSEAVYAAMRLARTVTGRDKIVVFNRDYHGNFDEVLVRGLGAAADFRTVPSAPGIPRRAVQDMYVLDYGSDEALAFIEKHADEIAAVLIEPVQSRRPEFQPYAFVKAVRALTERTGSLFIFDEVITGFRDGLKGAQAIFDVRADIATYGKVVGGGMPIGVVAGKAQYMDTFDGGMWQYGDDSAPEKPVTFFAGTFVRHPMTMAAVLAVLNYLKDQPVAFWDAINAKAKRLATTVDAFFVERGIPIRMPHFCSQMFVRVQDDQKFGNLLFFHLREKGIFLLESFPCYMTAAHTEADVDRVIAAFKESALALQEMGFFPPPPDKGGTAAALVSPKPIAPVAAVPPVTTGSLAPVNSVAAPTTHTNRFPLAEGQREMWLGAQMSPEAAGPHHACNVIDFSGPLDVAALGRALDRVIERHEGLRAVFSEDGTEVIIRPTLKLDMPVENLGILPASERAAAAEKFIRDDGRRIFDLTKGPLIAARILRFSEAHHQLVFTAQMIACDGWSHYVVFEELSAIYSAYVEGREPQLPPAIPMRDYAIWQQQHRNDDEAKACENFWLSKFKTIPAPLDLPTTGARPPNRTVTADRREIIFNQEFYSAIKSFAKEQKNSSFAVLLAAFQTWLYRLSGTGDVVVGVPFSAQGPLGFDTLVGQCANTLPLRAQLDPAESFSSLLKRTWNDLLDAQENWNYTFGRLSQQLALPRDPSRIPLVSVLFNIDPPMAKVGFARLKHRFITGPRFFFQYDLGFNLIEEEHSLRLECDYNVNLFDAATIDAWLACYELLLQTLVLKPSSPLGRVPMVQRPPLNAEAAPAPKNQADASTISALLASQFARAPQAIAVTDSAGSLTYTELDRRSAALANYLRNIGATAAAPVALCLQRTKDLAVGAVAVLRAGAPLLVLDSDAPAEANAQLLARAAVKFVVTHAALVDAIPGHLKSVSLDRDAAKIAVASKPDAVPTLELDGVALLVPAPTTPEGAAIAEITHRNFANLVSALQHQPGLHDKDALLAASPFARAAALGELLVPLAVGARVLIAPDTVTANPTSVVQFAATSSPTIIHATPSSWRALLDAGWRSNRMTRGWSSGEALNEDVVARLLTGGAELWSLYGAGEATLWSAVTRIERPHDILLGRAMRRCEIDLVDERAEFVPVGVPGEVVLSGEGVGPGYRNATDLTAERFTAAANGVRGFRTSDRARLLPGQRLEFLGRREREFKVRGCHVELSHVEAVLRQHGAIAGAVILPRNIGAAEPILVAYLTRKTEGHDAVIGLTEHALMRELRQLVRDQLPEYMRPARWTILARFPTTREGKLDYATLPLPAETADAPDDYAAPENQIQEKLVRIWQTTLKAERVGIRDSFFDLGGQSLLAVSLFSQIEKEFGRKLPLSTLFRAPTVEKLAKMLARADAGESDWSSLVPIQPKGDLTPLFLVHGAGGNVLLYRTLSHYLTPGRPLYGLQSRGLDGKSEPLNTIEAMAEAYLADVRSVQPRGPYLLGGYCLGGTVAYEMAQRLHQAGEEVALVAMLDTYNFSRALKASFAGFMFEKFKFHCANFARLRPSDMWSYMVEKIRLARDGELRNLMTSKPESAESEGVARATSGPEASVQAINDHAADTYLPKHYPGGITLFKPEANYKFYPDPKMGWGDLVGGKLESVEFPFKPHAMLVEPYVQQLAAALNRSMDGKAPRA